MFKVLLSELHHSVILMKWGRTQWMFIYFMVSGTHSEVTVHQPPLLTAALGHDVIMPCRLSLSNNEKMLITPVLYWMYNSTLKVMPTSDKYKERVHTLDNTNSSDKSILLKNVMWADSGKYLCKLSITTEDQSFRKKGNETLLIIHDTMFFNLTSHNDSQLQCEVNVTRDPRIVLSIFHDGCKFQTVNNAVTALPYNTLSETISLKGRGKYECQLHLNEDLIMKSIFHWHSPEPDVVFPEPWFLYMAMLLVPIIILLCLVIAMLKDRCCVVQHLAGTERRSKGESGCQQRKEMHLSNALQDMQQ
ncbi:uncharacterized protein LOC121906110 [Thunnus maccoyii]|uniref:uncharacterized protein LOC121906110 n=1 Tax=Thunnus maccoyii TaxID=8240 RepID=UPI001C4C8AD9|nr:uncharacterized protein LOC121906110 [Thunnus maccoyii]